KMSEFSLFAFDIKREDLLKTLQNFGYVHFNNLNEEFEDEALSIEPVRDSQKITEVEAKLSKVSSAVNILSRYEKKESGLKAMMDGNKTYDFKELEQIVADSKYMEYADEVLDISKKKESLRQNIEHLKAEIVELTPWKHLGVNVDLIYDTHFSDISIGTVPKKLKDKFLEIIRDQNNLYYEILNED
ncbi:hypothetical protein P7M25_26255, partial [Vibrio parahaemolyticus]|nr:hypothetical protein [Vibrio parahaemolyticus]